MATKAANFAELVEKVYQRMEWLAASRTLGTALLLGGVLSWSILFLFPATSVSVAAMVGGGSGIALAALLLILHHPTRMMAAAACDEAAGAAELFSTAVLLNGQWQTADPAWRRSVLAKAHEAAQKLDPAAVRLGSPKLSLLCVGVALLAGLSLWPAMRGDDFQTVADVTSTSGSPAASDAGTQLPIAVTAQSPAAAESPGASTAQAAAKDDSAAESATKSTSAQAAARSESASKGGAAEGAAHTQTITTGSPLQSANAQAAPSSATGADEVANSGKTGNATTRPAGGNTAGEVAQDLALVPPPLDPGHGSPAVGSPTASGGGEVPAAYRDIAREYLAR